MPNNPRVAIGIPAYNEEANIGVVIGDVLSQACSGFTIKEIIVSSDASTDRTDEIVSSIADSRIRLITNSVRQGIARGFNQIIASTTCDILVTLDADIRLLDATFIAKLIAPIIHGRADLTSSAITQFPPTTFFSKILQTSMLLKDVLFSEFNKSRNLYTCHGLARAYSRRFYHTLKFPLSIGNDMYSYLACISQGFNYIYASKAVAWYRLPSTFTDHRKQSQRFFISAREQAQYFDPQLVRTHTHIPKSVYFQAALHALPVLAEHPIDSLAYFFIQLYLRLTPSRTARQQAWDMSASTRTL